jgi:YhcN/YlaJ family sporulation lipoprotein
MRLLILLLAAVLTGLTGCTDRTGEAAPLAPEPGVSGETAANGGAVTPYGEQDPAYAGQTTADEEPAMDEATADRLERLAESVRGVNGAKCVVLGKVAIVGIDVDGKLDRGKVGSVKYAVAEALAKDPAGVRALVTADLDIQNRIRAVRYSAEDGRPLRGLAEQLAELIGRMMPQLPRDTAPKAEPQGHPDDRQNLNRQQGTTGQQQTLQPSQQNGNKETGPSGRQGGGTQTEQP